MSIGADFCIYKEAIEDSKTFSQCMMIGRDRPREEHKRRISIGLREIAKQLIVCSIFLDDVDHMLEWRELHFDSRPSPPVGGCHTC